MNKELNIHVRYDFHQNVWVATAWTSDGISSLGCGVSMTRTEAVTKLMRVLT